MTKRQRRKQYALLRRHKVTGVIEGMIDASTISMGWSTQALYTWDSPPSHYLPKFPAKDMHEYFAVRIHSKSCPVEVSFNRRWSQRSRNLSFKVKSQIPIA